MQPCWDNHVVPQPSAFPREDDKDCAGNVRGRVRILHLPQRCRIHHVDMPAHQDGECIFSTTRERAQQLVIARFNGFNARLRGRLGMDQ